MSLGHSHCGQGEEGRFVAGAQLITPVLLITWAGAHSLFVAMLRQWEDRIF